MLSGRGLSWGHQSDSPAPCHMPTDWPFITAALARVMVVESASVRQPNSRPSRSTARVPEAWEADVTTALAPMQLATSSANRSAPPTCPEIKLTQKLPASSIQTTAGSTCFVFNNGDNMRIVAQTERKTIMLEYVLNACSITGRNGKSKVLPESPSS